MIPSAIQSRPVPDAAPTIPGDDAAGRHAPPTPTPVSPPRRLAPRLFGEAYWLAPVLVLLAVASPHLDQGGFRSDTGRYAAVGLQAWREGNLLDLHLQEGVPYQNKPPLALWVHGLVLHTLGVSVWAARLPVVLLAAGSVALVARIGARLGGRPAGFLSGLVFALTYEYFRRVREISLDVWQTFFMLAAVWLVIRATNGRPRTRMAITGACIGLALMVKPLVGLVALPFMGLWLALTGRSRRLPSLLWALFVAGVVASPWHVAMALRQGDAFTGQYFGAEVVGRAIGEIQTLPPWYYLDILLRTYWPWNLVLMLGAWGWWKRRTRDRAQGAASNDPANDPPGRELVLLGLLWGAGWLGLISLFPDKYPRYAIPAYAGLAWVVGAVLAPRLARQRPGLTQRLERSLLIGAPVIGLVLWMLPIRWQAGHEPARGELLQWIDSQPPESVWAWKLSSNDLGDLYLALGWWPKDAGAGETCRAPAGAMVITRRHFGVTPTPPGDEVFRSAEGRYVVTRHAPRP